MQPLLGVFLIDSWFQIEQMPLKQAEVIGRNLTERNIEARGVFVFITTPAIQQIHLISTLNQVIQNHVESARGVNIVGFLWIPILRFTEAEFHGFVVKIPECAGAS
jgi:hypothetical protein